MNNKYKDSDDFIKNSKAGESPFTDSRDFIKNSKKGNSKDVQNDKTNKKD